MSDTKERKSFSKLFNDLTKFFESQVNSHNKNVDFVISNSLGWSNLK